MFFLYLILSLWVIIGITYGFDSIINEFDTHGAYNNGYQKYIDELFGFFITYQYHMHSCVLLFFF